MQIHQVTRKTHSFPCASLHQDLDQFSSINQTNSLLLLQFPSTNPYSSPDAKEWEKLWVVADRSRSLTLPEEAVTPCEWEHSSLVRIVGHRAYVAMKGQVVVQTMLSPTRYTLPEGAPSRHIARPQLAQQILDIMNWGTEVEKYRVFAPIIYGLQIEVYKCEWSLLK